MHIWSIRKINKNLKLCTALSPNDKYGANVAFIIAMDGKCNAMVIFAY